MNEDLLIWVYLSLPVMLVLGYATLYAKKQKSALQSLEESRQAGLTEPASLHPLIDSHKCIGCASCVTACPEGNVLGVINGKSQLVNPSHCIGHGACKKACPVDAISLVFGTEKRGVDIPYVNERFETNIPGIFIAGELGGMGLIRNAVEQGRQAMDAIRKRKADSGVELDVVIVGAGPAGFSASLAAMEHGLRYRTIEQESLGGAVFQFPRGKIVMTAPMKLPMVGKVRMSETTKEALLEFWQSVESKTGVQIHYRERMESIKQQGNTFVVTTNNGIFRTQSVLLAIGRRGTPRKLGVPGEGLPKVVYRLIDPEQYRNKRVLIVGGGDSALEAALSIAAEQGAQVTISYRSEAFNRAKEKNRARLEESVANGYIKLLMKSNVKEIFPGKVQLDHDGQMVEIENDDVIINAGGILPTPLLKEIGIEVETKYGTS
jgi:thioredoxin reductase/Pyruvate/2-oxoacid:ferredoxin oxidoreductase delta subunit